MYDKENPKTHTAGTFSKKTLTLSTMTARDFFKYWSLESGTIDFIGHSLALFQDDSFMDRTADTLVERIQLYKDSMLRFPNMTTPYIYPLYGLGEIPQSFARCVLCVLTKTESSVIALTLARCHQIGCCLRRHIHAQS
jgi:Rab GDP dissociation inhibitor